MPTVVGNDQIKRALHFNHQVGDLVLNQERDAHHVADVLQVIHDFPDWRTRFDPKQIGQILDSSKIREELVLWQQFYQKLFPDVNVGNCTKLRIPNLVPGFDMPIVTPRGIGMNQAVARMRKDFKVWLYADDLDASVLSDRNPVSSSYIVLVRNLVEADEVLKNKSAEMLVQEGIPGITLPERLFFGYFHWWKTGTHLDCEKVTLCAGSRVRHGRVPSVGGSSGRGKLFVFAYDPQDAFGRLRARAVAVS
jgi:hypothetical protein